MNQAKGWCWILCCLGLISSLLISEVSAQSDDDPDWGENGELPDWVEDGDLPDWVEEGERTDMSEGVFDDPGQGLAFRMIARDSAPPSSLDSPADGRSEVFEIDFDEIDNAMEALKYAPEDVVAEIIERFVEGC